MKERFGFPLSDSESQHHVIFVHLNIESVTYEPVYSKNDSSMKIKSTVVGITLL